MLAKTFNSKWLQPDGYIQPKLDGVRMVWTGYEAMSRRGKPINGVPSLIAILEKYFKGIPLDGELYAHGKSFQKTVGSIRRSKNIEEDIEIGYHVYDMPLPKLSFEERYNMLFSAISKAKENGLTRVHLVETVNVIGTLPESELNIFEKDGYEGTMWRSSNGLYKFGKRSSDLLKIKSMMEDEFEIVGLKEELTHEKIIVPEGTPGAMKYADGTWYKNGDSYPAGTCGALIVKVAEGVTVDVGSGMDDATKQEHWNNPPIGKMLTVKYQERTDDGSLRFPIYKAIRDYE